MRLHRRSAATAAIVLSASLATAPALAAPKPYCPPTLTDAVTVDATVRHLTELERITAATGGNRVAGTDGHEAAADYVEQTLRSAGYEPTRQYFDFVYERVLSTSLTQNSPTAGAVAHEPMSYSPSTGPDGITADLTAPAVATGCAAEDWSGVEAMGKIVLVSRGICSFSQKSVVAGAAGAAAVLIYNDVDGTLNGSLGGIVDGQIPTTGLTRDEGTRLLGQLSSGAVNVTFALDKVRENRRTFNIFAETCTGRADNVVMLGAHLDGVEEGPGINDNATGSAAILETAVQLGKIKEVDNKVRFAWWGAEELGLLGSNYYVQDLVENNPAEISNIAGYLNFDMVGSPNYIIGVYDANQSTYQAPVAVPPGSEALEQVFTDYFDSIDQAWVDTEFSGRSDYSAFIQNGVPASGLFTGADGSKTAREVELFGGTEGIAYDPNYHTAGDDLNNVDRTALEINVKAIASATSTLAYAPTGGGQTGLGAPAKPRELGQGIDQARDAA